MSSAMHKCTWKVFDFSRLSSFWVVYSITHPVILTRPFSYKALPFFCTRFKGCQIWIGEPRILRQYAEFSAIAGLSYISFGCGDYCPVTLLCSPAITILNPTLVWIFFTLYCIHFLMSWLGEFVWQSRAALVGGNFLHSRDHNVWFRGDVVRRNKMYVTLEGERVNEDPDLSMFLYPFVIPSYLFSTCYNLRFSLCFLCFSTILSLSFFIFLKVSFSWDDLLLLKNQNKLMMSFLPYRWSVVQ